MLNAAPIHEQLAKVVAALQAGDHFLIVGHVDPDPDCLGSMLALHWALRRLGKTSLPVAPDQIPTTCRFLPGVEQIRLPQDVNPLDFNVLVVVDCEPGRTGQVAAWLHHFTQVVNIDHHVTNSAEVPTTYLDPKAAAAGEMVHAIIKALGLHLDQEVATLLYTAIMADTGSFRFSNTNARVLQVGAELIEMGANPDLIAQQIYETHSWGYLQLLH
jgi:phosphoesterase RecJ-like protein